MKRHLIIFAKRPAPGHAKTRLGVEIGLEESAGVYARLLYDCLLEMTPLTEQGFTIEISLASKLDLPYFQKAFPECMVQAQTDGNLGARFAHTFQQAFSAGAEKVVVIGTDIPDLKQEVIHTAFQNLKHADVVIGPDLDGGYYLIGTRRPDAFLFTDIQWSSPVVYEQTKTKIETQQLSLSVLQTLADVDTGTDYRRWAARRRRITELQETKKGYA